MTYREQILRTMINLQLKSPSDFYNDWFNQAKIELKKKNFIALPEHPREGIFEQTTPFYLTDGIDSYGWFNELFRMLIWIYNDDLTLEDSLQYDGFRRRKKFVVINCLKCGHDRMHQNVIYKSIAWNFYYKYWVIKVDSNALVDLSEEALTFNSIEAKNWLKNFLMEFERNGISISKNTKENSSCPKCGTEIGVDTFNHDAWQINQDDEEWKLSFIRKNDSGWIS